MDEREEDSGPLRPDDAGGHLTTTIRRPQDRRASDAGRSRLGDLRRRIIAPHVSTRRLRATWLFGLAALVIAGAIAAALFGLPVRTWFDQDSELQALEHELTELQTVNHDLQNEVDRLQTDEGIREATRDELGHVQAGDNRQTILELPPLPGDLPDGWPYSQVIAILAVRAAIDTPPSTDPLAITAPTVATAPTATPAVATTAPATAATTVAPSTTVVPSTSSTSVGR
jgi:cell division protein FtsB